MKLSTNLLIAIVAALFLVGEISSFPTVTKKALPVKTASTDGTTTTLKSTTDPSDNKGYIRIALDDPQVKELTDYATEEVRLHQQSTDLSLKGIAFALKQISTASRTNNYKLTLVLTKTGEKPSQSLLCNVNILLGESANERQSKTNCIGANIVSGIQSISSNGTLQEDADLAAAIFATTEFNRQHNNSSSSLILLHYIASGSLEMISGMEYKLHMQMQGSAKDELMCDANILPRTPRILHGVECGAMSSVHAEKDVAGSYNTADVKDTDVKETVEFAANALTERQIIESSTGTDSPDRLSLVKVTKAWKKPVRGIQRRLRMTLSNDGEGANEPSSYCLAVIFEDRLSGEYELVNGPGNTVCSSTPPTA